MDVRSQRLQADARRLRELCARSSLIRVQSTSPACDRYTVTYICKGLAWLPGHSAPSVVSHHQMDLYLHLDYPRLPPRLSWLTEIFHPNILPPRMNGGVCIGRWTPAETLDQLILRIGEMVQYRNFSTTDALDTKAARWVERHRNLFPVDASPLLKGERDVAISLEEM